MKQKDLPVFRQKIFADWDKHFHSSTKKYGVSVLVHGLGITFWTPSETLAQSLRDFFPKSWITIRPQPITVHWAFDDYWDESSLRGDIDELECFKVGTLVWQRDFISQAITPNYIRLFCADQLGQGFFNFMRYLLPLRLLEQNQVLFHSACALDNGLKPHLFIGPSGVGKSTLVSKYPQETVLGEDLNLLTISHQGVFVETAAVGSQFNQHPHAGERFLLKQILILNQAEQNSLEDCRSERLQILSAAVAGLNWDELKVPQFQHIMHILSQVDRMVSLKQLNFAKGTEVIDYINSIDKV